MNAGLLISVPTGSNGAQAAGQLPVDASKAETHSDDTSFGHVLAQVGKQAGSSTDKTDAAPSTSATEAKDSKDSKTSKNVTDSMDSTTALSPLQLALQASAATAAQAGQDGNQVKGDGQPAMAQSDDAPLVTMVMDAQQANLAVQTGAATSAKTDGSAPAVSTAATLGNGALPSAADKTGPTTDSQSVDLHPSAPLTNQPGIADLVATAAQRDLLTTASDKGSTQASDRSAGSEPVTQATDSQAPAPTQGQGQGVAPGKTVQVEAAKALPVTAGLSASNRDMESPMPAPSSPRDGAGVKAETMTEANINVGQPIQTLSGQNADQQAALSAQTGLQDWTRTEQARLASAAVQSDKGKESIKVQKETQSAQSLTGAERFGIGDGRAGHIDGTPKVAVAVPVVVLPSEPPRVLPVQSLNLKVEHQDFDGVQVRVVLVDQTVHASVTTGQVDVKDLLVAGKDRLEAGLKASGLEMGEFHVNLDQQGRGQSGSSWFAGAQGDQANQGRRQSEPQPLYVEPRVSQWVGAVNGALGGGLERRTLNVFA